MKEISVIIPCYNVARWIDRCLTSIIRQTIGIDVLEVICIDDASTDDTWEHLQEWERKYPDNLVLIRQEVNRRQGAARNLGLQYASTEWIAFVDADDWLEPDYFELLYSAAEKYGCDVVCCGSEKDNSAILKGFDKKNRCAVGEISGLIVSDKMETAIWLLRNGLLGAGPCGKIIRTGLLLNNDVFFPEDMVFEDTYWCPMLHIYAKKIYLIKEKLYHWFVNPQSTVRSKNQDFCMDWIAVHYIKWEEYEARGFFQKYRAVLEYDFLRDAIQIISSLCECDEPSYSLYRLIRQIITEKISEPEENPYFVDFGEYFRCFIEALYSPLDKNDFKKFHEAIRQMKRITVDLSN